MCKTTNNLPKILFVDDDIDAIATIRLYLPEKNYSILIAYNGSEALRILNREHEKGWPVNLVVLDYRLPDTNGIELLQTIRRCPEIAHTKILIATCMDQPDLRITALKYGADDFLSKVCESEELLLRIENLVQRDINDRLMAEMNHRSEVLQEINNRISEDITSSTDLSDHLLFILEKLAQFVEYDSASIMLIENSHLTIVAHQGFRSEQQVFSYQQLEKLQHIQEVINTAKLQIIADTSQDSRWHQVPGDEYIRCWMGIPLIYKSQVIGVLNLDKGQPSFYTEQHGRDSLSFAGIAAIAINNARMIKEQLRISNLAQNLVKVSGLLAERKDLKSQIEAVWNFVSSNLKANMFFIALYEEFPRRLKFEAAYNMGVKVDLPNILLEDDDANSLAAHVFNTQASIRWLNESEKTDELKKARTHTRIEGSPSLSSCTLPLDAGGQKIGVISIQHDQPNAWTELELNAFSTLASQVAVNIQNTSLFKEIQDGSEYLENAYHSSETITSQPNPNLVLKEVVENTYKHLGAWWSCINLMDREGYPQRIEAGNFYRTPEIKSWSRRDGISDRVFKTGKAEFIENVCTFPEANPKLLADGVKAAACLPLVSNERTLGVLWVHYHNAKHFMEREKAAWNLYSNQAAIVYENSLKVLDLENIRTTSYNLARAESVEEVVFSLVQDACKLFKSDSAIYIPYNEDQQTFSISRAVSTGVPEEIWNAYKDDKEKLNPLNVPLNIFEKEEYLIIENVLDNASHKNENMVLRDFLSYLQIFTFEAKEIHLQSEKLGALFINYHHPYHPPESDRQKAFTLANQASLALKKVKLLEELRRVNQTSQAIANWTVSGDLKSTIDSIVEGTKNVLNCDVVTLYTYDHERGGRFDFPPAMNGVIFEDKVRELNHVERNSWPFRVLALDNILWVPDVTLPGAPIGQFTIREDVKSWVGVPLIVSDNKVGVMFVNYRNQHHFSKDDKANIQLFSNMAAVAISYAQQYNKQKRREKEAASILSIGYMQNMANTYLHSIKTYATTIKDQVTLIDDDIKMGLPPTAIKDHLEKIIQTISDIHGIQYFPTPAEQNYESIPINSLINERINQFKRKSGKYAENKFITRFKLPEHYRVRGYSELLRRVLDVLINNSVYALEKVDREKVITIETKLSMDRDTVEIRTFDTGCGIPDHLRTTLIQDPIYKKQGERGSGMGLYLAGIIVNMHKGSIQIEQTDDSGSIMLIRLPIEK